MSALAQLASKGIQADEALLERVKTLLNNLREKIETEFQLTSQAEQASIQAYNEDKARLLSTIAHLEKQYAGLEDEIKELTRCIQVQSGIVSVASQKKARNQNLLDASTALCNSVEAEYTSASASRKEELDLLSAIKERVEARFSQLQSSAVERGKQDSFQYDNAYEYKYVSTKLAQVDSN